MPNYTLGAFPTGSVLFGQYQALFNAGKDVVIGLGPTIILARALWNLFQQKGTVDHVNIIKDAVLALVLLGSFLSFLSFLTGLPSMLASMFPDDGTYSMKFSVNDLLPFSNFVKYLTIVCFWIAAAMYVAFLIFACLVAAYIIMAGTMLQSRFVLKAFFWVLIIMSSWPLLWYAFNMAIKALAQDDGFVNGCFIAFFNLLKTLSPLAMALVAWRHPAVQSAAAPVTSSAKLLKTGAAMAVAGTAGAIKTFGGNGVLKQIETKRELAKSVVQNNLKKTIPAMSAAAGFVASKAGKGISAITPAPLAKQIASAGLAARTVRDVFKNSKDPFTGETLPGSSPAVRTMRSLPGEARKIATHGVQQLATPVNLSSVVSKASHLDPRTKPTPKRLEPSITQGKPLQINIAPKKASVDQTVSPYQVRVAPKRIRKPLKASVNPNIEVQA